MKRRLRVATCAPSNIALIKYMGKREGSRNLPENGSLSFTLNSLCTFVEMTVERGPQAGFQWSRALPRAALEFEQKRRTLTPLAPSLNERGIQKLIHHFEWIKGNLEPLVERYGMTLDSDLFSNEPLQITFSTANTFPSASGIASSASSFAAMSLAFALIFVKDRARFESLFSRDPQLRRSLAELSRAGSGSSCRSFEGPWTLWEEARGEALEAPKFPELAHFVIIVSREEKRVSSSEAHRLVKSSPLWLGRAKRAQARIRALREALDEGNFESVAKTSWEEAWEMHSLFHTSSDPFSYWQPGSIAILQWFSSLFESEGRHSAIVTLDAGPNVHVLVRKEDRSAWRDTLKRQWGSFPLLEDQAGQGARILHVREDE